MRKVIVITAALLASWCGTAFSASAQVILGEHRQNPPARVVIPDSRILSPTNLEKVLKKNELVFLQWNSFEVPYSMLGMLRQLGGEISSLQPYKITLLAANYGASWDKKFLAAGQGTATQQELETLDSKFGNGFSDLLRTFGKLNVTLQTCGDDYPSRHPTPKYVAIENQIRIELTLLLQTRSILKKRQEDKHVRILILPDNSILRNSLEAGDHKVGVYKLTPPKVLEAPVQKEKDP